jgi:hypothetical protein
VTPDDLLEAESASRQALEPFIARDWPVRAGDLTWDVRTTVAHVCDAGGWYAAHLALQSPRRLRVDFRVHPDASNAELLDVLPTAAATLAGVARASPHGARAYHNAGMADTSDFLAMGCDEILVHCWDAVRGFGGKFAPPEDVAERILRRLSLGTDQRAPWQALLWANGRADLLSQERLGPNWVWYCAPLDEWDGTVTSDDSNPPDRYEWDQDARRWNPAR